MTEKIELDVQTKAFMEKLKEFQNAEGCVNDFEAILVPYVKDSLVNMIRGDAVNGIAQFLDQKLCCHRFYHSDHIAALCAKKCCNVERCQYCFHTHGPTATCACPHTHVYYMCITFKKEAFDLL